MTNGVGVIIHFILGVEHDLADGGSPGFVQDLKLFFLGQGSWFFPIAPSLNHGEIRQVAVDELQALVETSWVLVLSHKPESSFP